MSKEKKGFIVYDDTQEVVSRLSDEEAGQLFKGMLGYSVDGKAPKFKGVLEFIFIPIKQQMDRDAEKYEAKCEKNRNNIKRYWDKVKSDSNEYVRIRSNTMATNTDTDTDTDTKTDKDTDTTTDTDTDTNTKACGGSADDGKSYTDIWKSITADDVDTIYESYPESGGELIQTVYEDVKKKRKLIKKPVSYILGYAKRVGWDDNADHGGAL